jgi:hypothetical protein
VLSNNWDSFSDQIDDDPDRELELTEELNELRNSSIYVEEME